MNANFARLTTCCKTRIVANSTCDLMDLVSNVCSLGQALCMFWVGGVGSRQPGTLYFMIPKMRGEPVPGYKNMYVGSDTTQITFYTHPWMVQRFILRQSSRFKNFPFLKIQNTTSNAYCEAITIMKAQRLPSRNTRPQWDGTYHIQGRKGKLAE